MKPQSFCRPRLWPRLQGALGYQTELPGFSGYPRRRGTRAPVSAPLRAGCSSSPGRALSLIHPSLAAAGGASPFAGSLRWVPPSSPRVRSSGWSPAAPARVCNFWDLLRSRCPQASEHQAPWGPREPALPAPPCLPESAWGSSEAPPEGSPRPPRRLRTEAPPAPQPGAPADWVGVAGLGSLDSPQPPGVSASGGSGAEEGCGRVPERAARATQGPWATGDRSLCAGSRGRPGPASALLPGALAQ